MIVSIYYLLINILIFHQSNGIKFKSKSKLTLKSNLSMHNMENGKSI